MNWRHLTLPVALLALALLAACGQTKKAYEGQDRPKDQVATLKTMTFETGIVDTKYTWVKKIDGKDVPWGGLFMEVLPGPHELYIRYQVTGPSAGLLGLATFYEEFGILKFNAEAGHAYDAYSKRVDKRLWRWVLDTTTDKVVAGEKPP